MITTRQNRLDPSLIEPGDVQSLLDILNASGQPALVDESGQRIALPQAINDQLLRILQMMKNGQAIIMLPEDETFTTQAAANYLGVSRQHFVNLLEDGALPFHRVGTHRRVHFKDLLEYESFRDKKRREALRKLSKDVSDAGLYDAEVPTTTR
ncbi:helix-turn-helix domain-containing protein [Akkermansiaceae bacterium]|nr:helix-turn-helix domain-containing protein [Akkermansiaceae bacterium]